MISQHYQNIESRSQRGGKVLVGIGEKITEVWGKVIYKISESKVKGSYRKIF